MWTSPNPPQATGKTLAKLMRGEDEVLRVALAEYRGNPYVSLRVWARGQDGQWWPRWGKGVSVRIRELSELADVLRTAADGVEDDE